MKHVCVVCSLFARWQREFDVSWRGDVASKEELIGGESSGFANAGAHGRYDVLYIEVPIFRIFFAVGS